MSYSVKEIFYTLQGEGANSGRPAVFCRFAGCNLWSGREEDRAAAVCTFCDTDFVGTDGDGGGRFVGSDELADAVAAHWPTVLSADAAADAMDEADEAEADATDATDATDADAASLGQPTSPSTRIRPLVVCTGGEPLLQLDVHAVDALHARGFEVAVETNGTRMPPSGLDWVCVSPKAGAEMRLRGGNEMKLVYPQAALPPEAVADFAFDHFFLQPMDGPHVDRHTSLALDYCLKHPQWRLSLQTHKLIGIR